MYVVAEHEIDDFWNALTPSRAFLARVFVEYCVEHKDEARLEHALPVVTALAFQIQTEYNILDDELTDEQQIMLFEGTIPEEREELRMEREFIIGEVLRLAVNLDYADEIGRRKMFSLVREYLQFRYVVPPLIRRTCSSCT